MIFEKTKYPITIIKKLELKRIYHGDYSTWKWKKPFFLKRFMLNGRMNPHVVIIGESGGGKSNASRVIIKEIADTGAGLLILDPNEDYLGLADKIGADVYDASRSKVNFLDLDGMDEEERIGETTSILSKRLRLGYVQSSLLKRCIGYTYWVSKPKNRIPTVSDLMLTLKRFEAKAEGSESRTLSLLIERISLINSRKHGRPISIEKIMGSRSIFLLGSMHTEEEQSIYMEALLRKIYSSMLSSGYSRKPFYIVIDEARKISGSVILGRLAAEGRKYGLGIVAISQKAEEIDGKVMSNSSTIISFYQREPSELHYISNYISGGSESGRLVSVKSAIRNLGVGKAVILDSRYREPIMVKFESSDIGNFSLKYYIENLSYNAIGKNLLVENLHRMNISDIDIQIAVSTLISEKILYEYNDWYISNPRNSPEHDITVYRISEKLKVNGISNEIYNSSYGPDLIIYSKGRRIAMEYETGKKNLNDVIHMLEYRKKSYPEIILAVNDLHYPRYSAIPGITVLRISDFFASNPEEYL
jgi:hypothetical protein